MLHGCALLACRLTGTVSIGDASDRNSKLELDNNKIRSEFQLSGASISASTFLWNSRPCTVCIAKLRAWSQPKVRNAHWITRSSPPRCTGSLFRNSSFVRYLDSSPPETCSCTVPMRSQRGVESGDRTLRRVRNLARPCPMEGIRPANMRTLMSSSE
jgi:hypothetical protein